MKTSNQPDFKTLPDTYLVRLLKQLVGQYPIVQVFYSLDSPTGCSYVILHVTHKKEATSLQSQKWVNKARVSHNWNVFFFYSFQLQMLYNSGNPFIAAYCTASTLLYTNPEANTALETDHSWKRFKKKYNRFQESFYHDHDLLASQIPPLVKTGNALAVLPAYENLFAYELEYLESLYTGHRSSNSLHKRIASLALYAPEIQQYFVKRNGNTYYLIHWIEEAKAASSEGETFFATELFEALHIAQEGLLQMIATRLDTLKRTIKKKMRDIQTDVTPSDFLSTKVERKLYRGAVNLAITTIQKTKTPEEIYLFHQTHPRAVTERSRSEGGDLVNQHPPVNQTHYLLLIGNGFSNQLLKDLTAKIQAQTGNKAEFVLIAHTRSWIQEWLYAQQNFFKKIIQEENRIFTTSPYHPTPHWEHPYTPDYPDLELYHKQTVMVFDQFLLMADRFTDNYTGVANLFSLFFQTFCKTYLFATINYYPNILHSKALWQLCLYANPELKRYEYLFQELEIPFFNFVDHNRTIQLTYPFKQKQKTNILINLADKLLIELQNKLPSP